MRKKPKKPTIYELEKCFTFIFFKVIRYTKTTNYYPHIAHVVAEQHLLTFWVKIYRQHLQEMFKLYQERACTQLKCQLQTPAFGGLTSIVALSLHTLGNNTSHSLQALQFEKMGFCHKYIFFQLLLLTPFLRPIKILNVTHYS